MTKPHEERITVETLESGQPRPYADHVYRYRLRFEVKPNWGANADQWQPSKRFKLQDAIAAGRLLCGGFKTREEKPDWHERQLTRAVEESPGVFLLDMKTAFTD